MRWPVYILAGGRSTRFGSDKARALVAGEPMLRRVARWAQPLATSITVIAETHGRYDDLNLSTVGDDQPQLGPLGGLATALRCCVEMNPGWLVLLSCDLLVLRRAWFDTLWAARCAGSHAIAFRHEKWEPLVALYHTDTLATVEAQLAADRRSMQALLDALAERAVAVPLPTDWPERLQANRPDEMG